MAAAPERGILGSIRGFFERFFRGEAFRRPPPPRPQARQPQEQEERRTKAALIKDELKNITPSHQAYEVLKGVDFSEVALQNEQFANLVLNIIHAPDPNLYHDPDWLRRTRESLQPFRVGLAARPQDFAKLNDIEGRVNTLIAQADQHRRRVELDKELKKGEWLGEEEKRRERERVISAGGVPIEENLQPEQNWHEEINNLPDDAMTREIKRWGNTINVDPSAGETWGKLATSFESALKGAIKDVSKNPRDPILKERYEKLRGAYDKAARQFVELHGHERSRLYEAIRQHGGPEFLERKIHEDQNYMDYWFYHIIEPILYNQRAESHRELYNLYLAGDMDIFLDMVRRKKDDQGNRVGLKLAARYNILRNTIFQAHDMDYYAAHPSQDMKEFIGNTSLFLNTYIDAATQDPMVSLAKRMYEVALYTIRDTNNGFIPREWLQWEEGKMRGSKLDEMVEQLLKEAINSGQLYHIKRDDVTGSGLPHPSVWGRKQIDSTKPFTLNEIYGFEAPQSQEYGRNLGDLRIASALKQAKGLALVDMRLLEIIGRSRGTTPSTDYYYGASYNASAGKFNLAAQQFNSVPYEGIVRHIEPIIHYFSRYRVGFEYYDAFFNMMINDDPKAKWDPKNMIEVVRLHQSGDYEKLTKFVKDHHMGNLDTRLTEMDNPFQFSNMWGPNTGWRLGDASLDFDDWEKDRAYAAAIKVITAENWAMKKAQQFYVEVKNSATYKLYRNEYRQRLINSDDIRLREMAQRDLQAEGRGNFDDEFEDNWRKTGIREKKAGATKTYESLLSSFWDSQLEHGRPKEGSEAEKLVKKLKAAYIARAWVQASMKVPLAVARELSVNWNKAGSPQESALRRKIIWDILHIDVDQVAAMRTPLAHEEAAFNRIAELEGVVAAISQAAIRENRDLTEADFNKIENETLRQNAKAYWNQVKKAMLGHFASAEEMYRAIGIESATRDEHARGLRSHHLNWDVINRINIEGKADKTKAHLPDLLKTTLLKDNLINREWRYLFSTEDMGWEYLNIGALGERNPVRRAGDLASHVQFGQEFEKYLTNNIVARPKIPDLVKQMKVMWEVMAGDFADIASDSVGRVAYTTGMMYRKADWAWKYGPLSMLASVLRDNSIMQIIRGRDRADAWGPNDMLNFVQSVGGQQIVPKRKYSGLGGKEIAPKSQWTGATLGKRLGGTKANATWEIINTVFFVAMLITMYRAFTAKSEEESS